MSLNTAFPPTYAPQDSIDPWQLPMFPHLYHTQENDLPDMTVFNKIGATPQSVSPELLQLQIPQYVEPQELYTASTPDECPASPQSQPGSLDSSSTYVNLDRQKSLRRLSFASSEMTNDTYRPRNTPARRRKSTTSRITPRSDKHARELELNRKAATKCRNRQKLFVENLQDRCRKEETKLQLQTSLVHALHDEVAVLRNELIRQSLCGCGCQSVQGIIPAITV